MMNMTRNMMKKKMKRVVMALEKDLGVTMKKRKITMMRMMMHLPRRDRNEGYSE